MQWTLLGRRRSGLQPIGRKAAQLDRDTGKEKGVRHHWSAPEKRKKLGFVCQEWAPMTATVTWPFPRGHCWPWPAACGHAT